LQRNSCRTGATDDPQNGFVRGCDLGSPRQ
jgi:hypothetical protein